MPVICDPSDSVKDQQNQQSVTHVLNLKDEEGGDGLDIEGFSDVCLFLGFHLKFQECIT